MKLKALTVIVATVTSILSAAPSRAQMSGDVIRIGLLDDMSGQFSDLIGPAAADAMRMAIADMGGAINGKKIELITFDHQNKADVAASGAREWLDQGGVDVIVGGSNSSAGLAVSKIANDKKKPFLVIGALTTRLTNEECSLYTIRWGIDTVALARGTAAALVKQGVKNWFFLTADYAFGAAMEADATRVIKAGSGTVVGSVKHPLFATDFSSFLLQAQASKAQIVAFANAGRDTVSAIKAASEFGITKNMKMTGLLLLLNDVHALGLQTTQDMFLTDIWYWDQSAESRQFSKRFFEKAKRMPNSSQAATYSAVYQYLLAVKATGTDDPHKVMSKMRSSKLNDMYVRNGVIRPDGLLLQDVYLMQVKKPAESTTPWDYLKVVQPLSGDLAFTTKAETKCQYWK
ncbi:MAG: ABC transporter substrate-binding protein [Ramlibacter sp.]|nr:ABC transporter substrate-binding protein [Ramlibacter sp.]